MSSIKKVEQKTKKVNPWLVHVKSFRAKNPEMSYKEILQKAKLTYTPIKKEKVVKKAKKVVKEEKKEEVKESVKPEKKTRKPRKKKD